MAAQGRRGEGAAVKAVAYAPWHVTLAHRLGRCAAEVAHDFTLKRCSRSGLYGWKGRGYCYQHHPDYPGWVAEHRRLEALAQGAVDAAEAHRWAALAVPQ